MSGANTTGDPEFRADFSRASRETSATPREGHRVRGARPKGSPAASTPNPERGAVEESILPCITVGADQLFRFKNGHTIASLATALASRVIELHQETYAASEEIWRAKKGRWHEAIDPAEMDGAWAGLNQVVSDLQAAQTSLERVANGWYPGTGDGQQHDAEDEVMGG